MGARQAQHVADIVQQETAFQVEQVRLEVGVEADFDEALPYPTVFVETAETNNHGRFEAHHAEVVVEVQRDDF